MKIRKASSFAAAMIVIGCQPAVALAQPALELEVDLLEVHLGQGDDHLVLDSTLTVGEGPDQFLIKAAGGSDTRTAIDDLEVQGLYSRAISETTALHVGARHDIRAGSDLTHAVAGLVGEVLPGFEAEHYLFLSENGHLTGAGQLLLGVDIASQLVIEPRLAFSWSAQAIAGEDLGNGLTDLEASFRLRRSIGGYFNVYTGVVHERLLGSTRAIAVAAGDPSRVTRLIIGLGFTF